MISQSLNKVISLSVFFITVYVSQSNDLLKIESHCSVKSLIQILNVNEKMEIGMIMTKIHLSIIFVYCKTYYLKRMVPFKPKPTKVFSSF